MLINRRNGLMAGEKTSGGYWGLCFTAEAAGSTVALAQQGSPPAVTLRTSADGKTWTDYAVGSTITLADAGDKVYFAAGLGGNATISSDASNYYSFSMSGRIAASGSVMSLLDWTDPSDEVPGHCYYSMFRGCTSLTVAPELPATTLANSCYYSMFRDCTSLTAAPELPATTLANSCYFSMFYGCTSLTVAPELPATTLTTSCYASMFRDCTSLTAAPELPATTLATSCYFSMFRGCTKINFIRVAFSVWNPTNATTSWMNSAGTQATGEKTFYCPSALPELRGQNNIPTGWTIVRTDAT